MDSRNYRDLIAWQRGMDFAEECYRLTERFPRDERFGLTAQLHRAAVSVPSNIAEGHGRGHVKAFMNHLWIANGSLREAETQILLAHRIRFIPSDPCELLMALADEVGRLITGLRRSLGRQQPPDPQPPPALEPPA